MGKHGRGRERSSHGGYQTYRFSGQDPIVAKTLRAAGAMSKAEIERKTGVTAGTLRNWATGKTKRPLFSTLNAVLRGAGKKFEIVDK